MAPRCPEPTFCLSQSNALVESPLCRCGMGNETAYHVVVQCLELEREREALQRQLGDGFPTDRADSARATSDSSSGQAMARSLPRLARLTEDRLAVRLARDRY